MIKAQTAVKGGGGEGGREEGREEKRFLERRARQDVQKEKEEGIHWGGLFQSRGCVLTGTLYTLVSNTGGGVGGEGHSKTPAGHFLMYGSLESTDRNSLTRGLVHRQAQTHMCSYTQQTRNYNDTHTVSSPRRWRFGFR